MIEKKRATAATVTQGIEPNNGPHRLYHKVVREWIIPLILAAVVDFSIFIAPWLIAASMKGML